MSPHPEIEDEFRTPARCDHHPEVENDCEADNQIIDEERTW